MKVLKIAAIVVGAVVVVATAGAALGAFGAAGIGITGVGSAFGVATAAIGGALGVSAGLVATIGIAALAIDAATLVGAIMPKPSAGGSQTKWKADPYAGIPYVMGRTLTSGNIVYKRAHGSNNKFLTAITVLGLGPFASIDSAYADKSAIAFDGGGNATGTFRNQIYEQRQLGAQPEAIALTSPVGAPPGLTSAHKLSGLCAVLNTWVYDSQSKNGLTSIPQPAWIVHGCKVYDPRLDSTYPGGSGSCRAGVEATYVWSENPHLHALTWCIGRFQNGVRVAGIGSPVASIDVAAFVEGANLDDARSWKIGGQVYTRPDTLWNSLKAMLQAGGAAPVMIGGKISCVNRAPRVSLATIGPADIVGNTTFAATQPRRSRINGIIPQYRSEAHDWELVSATGVLVSSYVTIDGDERTREIAYPLVQDVNQVAQLAAYDICDAREAGPGNVPVKPAWLNYRVGDCITFAPEAGVSLKCIVQGRSLDPQTGTVTLTLRGETDGKHAFALGQTGTAPPIASLSYDPTVAAPASFDWSLAGATLTGGGASVPALVLTGANGNPSADAVVFDYRVYTGAGMDPAVGWSASSIDAPTTTRREFLDVTPGTQYQVGVRYRVRGTVGDRQIYGPVTAGNLVSQAIAGQGDLATTNQAALPFGVNAAVNSDFTSTSAGWLTPYLNTNVPSGVQAGGRNFSGYYGVRNALWGHVSNPTDAVGYFFFGPCQNGFDGSTTGLARYGLQVQPNDRVYARARIAIHGGSIAYLRIRWFSSTGTLLHEDDFGGVIGNARSGGPTGLNGDPANYYLAEGYANAPASANYAVIGVWGTTVADTTNHDAYLFVAEPMLTRVPAGQTKLGLPYTPGPADRPADTTGENNSAGVTGASAWLFTSVSPTAVMTQGQNVFPYPRGTQDGRSAATLGWLNNFGSSGFGAVGMGTYPPFGGGFYQASRDGTYGAASGMVAYYDYAVNSGWTGTPWALSLNMYAANGGAIRPYVQCIDSARTTSLAVTNLSYNSVSGRYEGVVTQPAGTAYVRIGIQADYAATTGHQDMTWWAVKLEANSVVTPYNEDGSVKTGDLIRWSDGSAFNSLKPAQAGADVTGANTAARIAGQGNLATLDAVTFGTSTAAGFGTLAGQNTVNAGQIAVGAVSTNYSASSSTVTYYAGGDTHDLLNLTITPSATTDKFQITITATGSGTTTPPTGVDRAAIFAISVVNGTSDVFHLASMQQATGVYQETLTGLTGPVTLTLRVSINGTASGTSGEIDSCSLNVVQTKA